MDVAGVWMTIAQARISSSICNPSAWLARCLPTYQSNQSSHLSKTVHEQGRRRAARVPQGLFKIQSVACLCVVGRSNGHASARTMPLLVPPPPMPTTKPPPTCTNRPPPHTQQEPLKTKTMAKEKIYYKKLPWSPKLIGQPVGPLKGAWRVVLGVLFLFLFLTGCGVGLGMRNEPFGRGHARCVLVFCVVGIGLYFYFFCLALRAGDGGSWLWGWGLSCCLSRLKG